MLQLHARPLLKSRLENSQSKVKARIRYFQLFTVPDIMSFPDVNFKIIAKNYFSILNVG